MRSDGGMVFQWRACAVTSPGLFPTRSPKAPLADFPRGRSDWRMWSARRTCWARANRSVRTPREGRLHDDPVGSAWCRKDPLARLMARACDASSSRCRRYSGVKRHREPRRARLRCGTLARTILFVDGTPLQQGPADAFRLVEQGCSPCQRHHREPLLRGEQALCCHAVCAEAAERRNWACCSSARAPLHGRHRRCAGCIVGFADGARRLLNMLEQIADAASSAGLHEVDPDYVRQTLASKLRQFDKGGDVFYDQISALHKSVRGSAPDAALYWLCRMLDGGADPLYIGRRLVRIAVADIGLADPRALRLALDACETYERLGTPKANWHWRRPRCIWRARRRAMPRIQPTTRCVSSYPTTARGPCRSICAMRPPGS